MNSNVSRQWLLDRYAINAASVHGASAVFANISLKFGLRGQYGPWTDVAFGIATDSGLEGGTSSVDMESSSSLSVVSPAAENNDGGFLEDAVEVLSEKSDDGFRTTITFWKRERPNLSDNADLRFQ